MTVIKQPSDPALPFFISKLTEKYRTIQIFSFGHIIKHNHIDTCFAAHRSDFVHQHFLLMVTEETHKIEPEVQDFANAHYKDGIITILCFNEENLRAGIAGNNRFFITVINNGQLLYGRDEMMRSMKVKAYDSSGSLERDRIYINRRLPLAAGFLNAAGAAFNEGNFNICVFLLHQCVEQSCILLIRIFMEYRTDVHNLKRLFGLCACFSTGVSTFFLTGQWEDERLFEILRTSYNWVRYKDDYFVDPADANHLWLRVGVFLKLVRMLCKERIEALMIE